MYQIMDLKDMELHGAALLFQREYEESRRSGEVPAMTPEMEADVEAGLRQIRENAYGAALLEDEELAGFLGFLGPIEGFHGAALRTARRAHEKKPLLFPKPQGMVQSFLAREDVSILAAFWKDTAVGYMAVDEEGETFVTLREDMLNICGAYVSREFRSAGVAKQLLDAAVSMAQERGKTYLGVDYETVNPTALHFWTKYFTPYTYSYIRRIDERVVKG